MAAKIPTVDQRVRRISKQGCHGTVTEVRTEVTANTTDGKDKEKPLIISVMWDNGSYSHFAPEGLEIIS